MWRAALVLALLLAIPIANGEEPEEETQKELEESELVDWAEGDHKSIKEKLQAAILAQYGRKKGGFKFTVPRKSGTETLNVTLRFMLREIAKVNEQSQRVHLTGALLLNWHDEYLSWTPSQHGGLRTLQLNSDQVWVPPVRAMDDTNLAHMWPLDWSHERNMMVTSSGVCIWGRAIRTIIRCPAMDYGNFPNDVHTCRIGFTIDHIPQKNAPGVRMVFGSDKMAMGVKSKNGKLKLEMIDHFIHPNIKGNLSLQWKLLHFWRNETQLEFGGKHLHSSLFYNIQFQRKAPYFGLSYVLPILMSTVFLILTFLIPLGSQQRYWMTLGGFLSLCLIYNRLFTELPPASETVPKIVRFYGLTLVMSLLCLLETVLLHRFLYRLKFSRSLPPPAWVQGLVGCFGRLVCYNSNTYLRMEEDQRSFDVGHKREQNNTISSNGGGEDIILDMVTTYDSPPRSGTDWEDMARICDSIFFIISFLVYLIGYFALLF